MTSPNGRSPASAAQKHLLGGPRSPADAVGHTVVVGDTVLALLGRRGARGVVERVNVDRAVVRRDGDGFKAVLATASLVVQRPIDRRPPRPPA